MPTIRIRDIVCEPGHKACGFLDVAETPGSTVRIPVMVVNGVQTGPTICLVGGTHPTEYCGIVSIIRLMQTLDTSQLTGAVIAVPVINLPGFEVMKDFNPIDGLQMLEACPGIPTGTMTHRIAYTLFEEIVSRSDYVIDFHGGGKVNEHIACAILRTIGDDKIDAVSEGMARHSLMEYISLRKVTGNWIVDEAIKRDKPGITVERGGEGKVREDLVELNFRGTTNVMRYLKILKGEPQTPPEQKIMRGADKLLCNRGGIFLSRKKPGDPMKKGETIGEVMDLFGNVVEAITAPFDGVIYFVHYLPPVCAGDLTFAVASFEGELSHRGYGYKGDREGTYVVDPKELT
jgi:predicted deacylase